MSQIPDHLQDAPAGWRSILDTLHDKLVRYDADYSVAQVKEKFGALRVYLDTPESNDIRNAVAEAEWKSERTCEVCGGYGRQVQIRGWWRALCRTHEVENSGVQGFL